MKNKLYIFFYSVGCLLIAASCNKKNDYSSNSAEVIREWNLTLSSSNENYKYTGPATEAAFHMVVINDNSVSYDVKIDSSQDRILAARIHMGDPVSEGALLLNLPVRIYTGYASGTITGLAPSVIETLLNNSVEKYINVTSERSPQGLIRGQLNSTIVLSKNVSLTGMSLVPPVATTTTGTAYLRMTSNNTLYSKIVIADNDPTDPLTTATLNQGTSTVNGPVLQTLVSSPSEFGVGKKVSISTSLYSMLLNSSAYVIANSTLRPSGKIRGQLK